MYHDEMKKYMSGKEYFEKKNAKKRDEQNLYDIRWNVNKIEMTSDSRANGYRPEISVEVVGNIHSCIGAVKLEDIAVELQNRMNNRRGDSVEIKKVVFNPPATIVLWSDGTKTVVKTQNGEEFDPEKGLAMAMVKKVMGNTGSYFDEIKKWTEVYSKPTVNYNSEAIRAINNGTFVASNALKDLVEAAKRLSENTKL